MKQISNAVRLEFGPDRQVHKDLSGAVFSGRWLWVAGDEACGVDLLERLPPTDTERLRFGAGQEFALSDLLDLPGENGTEADIEGLAIADGWLWLVGSHSLKRKRAKRRHSDRKNAKRLNKLALDANRLILACIPIETLDGGVPSLTRQSADGRRAIRLPGDDKQNALTKLLAEDRHLAPFLKIPGKDNGFDIEGIAVRGRRVMLGLRGPVLRGSAVILEIEVEQREGGLEMVPLTEDGLMMRKHFLNLQGLGIRDMDFHGDDLNLLAGPTMALDGDIRLFNCRPATPAMITATAPAAFHHDVLESIELPHTPGHDRAEAICRLTPELEVGQGWLVLYDAPGPQRRAARGTVFGDLLLTETVAARPA